MKFKFLLPLICVTSLASCASIPSESTGGGLVKDGVAFDQSLVRDSVPEEVREQKEQSVIGAVMTGTTKVSTSINMNGQKQSSSQTVSIKEEFDFVNKKFTATQKADGQKVSYTIQIVGDDVVFSSEYVTEEQAQAQGIDTTLAGMGALFEMTFKSLFSFDFIPTSEDLEAMAKSFESMGYGGDYSDIIESVYNNMIQHYVMAGDFENGNVEFGISEPFAVNMQISGASVNLKYNKLKAVFKNYLCTESVTSITETIEMSETYGDYSYYMNMKITSSSSCTYSYIFA